MLRALGSAFLLLWLLPASGAAAPASESAARPAPPAALEEAIRRGATTLPTPYRLRVHCTGDREVRSLHLHPSGVAIWNERIQVTVPDAVRGALLTDLLERGFLSLEPRYGGRAPAGSPAPDRPRAALRIACRVAIEIDGLERTSVQLAEGEQSEELAALANALLDRVEVLAADGVGADSLADGLAKLADGLLAPEAFALRLVELPTPPGSGSGSILRVDDGKMTLREYAPGRDVGEPVTRELPQERFRELAAEIGAVDPAGLPVNLWSESHLELELEVLAHRKAVVARPFSRLAPGEPAAASQRFERLLAVLRELESGLLR